MYTEEFQKLYSHKSILPTEYLYHSNMFPHILFQSALPFTQSTVILFPLQLINFDIFITAHK